MRTIFHLDLDAFFVSVERLLDPSLEGKPVIVGADPEKGRGVVSTCSYEARKFGVHSAMPIRQAYKLCPQGIFIGGHMGEYAKYSKKVREILEQYAPSIEQTSIDEYYMDFTGCEKIYGAYDLFAEKLQKEIIDELNLPCSIGIASNKTVAKIASDFHKPHGITYVVPGKEKEFLSEMRIEKIPGIGKVTTRALNERGFHKVKDITRLNENYFSTAFGKAGIALWNKCNGRGAEYLNPPQERKSISKERTFSDDVLNINTIEETLFKLTGKVCQMLRNKDWQASTISIKLRYSDFNTITRAKTVKPTDDDKIVYETALALFQKAYTRRVSIRLVGIHLTNFSEFGEQEDLFTEEMIIKRKQMLRAVTKLRDKFGYSILDVGKKEKKE